MRFNPGAMASKMAIDGGGRAPLPPSAHEQETIVGADRLKEVKQVT